ncbi:MAG: 2-hydroxychromene-2-carboxylate isomerase [Deltaproteobacteria bacterium]|nr:2-hydroxychromene-2-carboxylate isomerase [Deltaproteobacteria bacterium]
MEETLEFWFDFSCPYAFIASTRVEAVAERTGATLVPRPILLGGLFRAIGQPTDVSASLGAAKARYNALDVQRQARLWDVPLTFPKGHPLRTVTPLRALLAAGEPRMDLIHRFYRAYWIEGVDISTDAGTARVLGEAGLDADALLAKARTDAIKDALRQRTDEAVARGVFGVPTFGTGKHIQFGQDRLAVVEAALGGNPPSLAEAVGAGETEGAPLSPVDFWFDYSSPFSAIAAARAEAAFGDALRMRPMLLGGVFRDVGMDNLPMQAMSPPKRVWAGHDMARQARDARMPFRWPSRFPMRTILPLRMTLAAGPDTAEGRALIRAFYRAYWCDDRNIGEADEASAIASEAGLDGPALVQATAAPEIKEQLIANGSEAVAAGVFGAPTFVVHHADGERSLYWGNDRLELALLAARGDRRAR